MVFYSKRRDQLVLIDYWRMREINWLSVNERYFTRGLRAPDTFIYIGKY